MNAHANPLPHENAEMSLSTVLATLALHDDKALVFTHDGWTIGAGYHVTEVKAGSFVTLDCGGNPDAWNETVLQIEDLPPGPGQDFMTAGKFRAILAKVAGRVTLDADARLTIEVGPPDVPMQVFDVADIAVSETRAVIRLGARPAICKPRHRAEQPQAACCAPKSAAGSSCCA